MKYLLLLALCSGCSTREITIGDAHYKSTRLLGKDALGEAEVKQGENSLHIKGFRSDQVSGMAEIAEAAARGAAAGVKP